MSARAWSGTRACGGPSAPKWQASSPRWASRSWASSPRRSRAETATGSTCSERAVAERVNVARLGAKADGIAEVDGSQIFVPRALPGETVLIEREGARAHLLSVETPSKEREQPFCPYF